MGNSSAPRERGDRAEEAQCPIFPVEALRSIEITTPHLAGSVEFYTRVWGLDVAAEADGTVYLAATGGDFHVLELTQGEVTSLRKVTFRTRSREDLQRLFDWARDRSAAR